MQTSGPIGKVQAAESACSAAAAAVKNPDEIPASQAVLLYETLERAGRAIAVAKTLLARRVADSQQWRSKGHGSAAEPHRGHRITPSAHLRRRTPTRIGPPGRPVQRPRRLIPSPQARGVAPPTDRRTPRSGAPPVRTPLTRVASSSRGPVRHRSPRGIMRLRRGSVYGAWWSECGTSDEARRRDAPRTPDRRLCWRGGGNATGLVTVIGFHASHEQVHPADLLRSVQRAEEVGFTAAMSSDHFAPWSARQGHSGFAWAWLGAAMATTSLPFGIVSAPGQRYHPAIVAQAAATLSAMHPGRLWVALGTGEASNEHITGDRWPPKAERTARLEECVDVIRRLHRGEEVTHDGLVRVDRARIWTLPDEPPPLIGAAVSAETAARVGAWADGLVTVDQPLDDLRRVLDAYRDAGGRGPASLQVHLSYAASDDEALAIAHDQWRSNVIGPPACWDIDSVEAFDVIAERVRPEDVRGTVLVSSDPRQHGAWIAERAALGFDAVYLHHVGQEQDEFLDVFGKDVLPDLA